MVNAAIIQNGVVVNIAVADPDYAAKQGWVISETAKIGDTYDGVVFTSPVSDDFPKTVTALQGMLAIDKAGLSPAYDSWASNPSRTFAEKDFINKALYWRYDDDVLNAGCQALGITEAQKKQLFILAASL